MKKLLVKTAKILLLVVIICILLLFGLFYYIGINAIPIESHTMPDKLLHKNPSQEMIEKDSQTTIYSFFGKPIIINDSLCEQIVSIAGQDEMLSYNDSIIKIGEVWWRLNVMPNSIALMTSVQPDDPKMKHVIKYLNGIYGKPYDDHEDGYSIKWSSSGDSSDVFRPGSTLVHLRRVHTEEGGTFLIFQ